MFDEERSYAGDLRHIQCDHDYTVLNHSKVQLCSLIKKPDGICLTIKIASSGEKPLKTEFMWKVIINILMQNASLKSTAMIKFNKRFRKLCFEKIN